MLKKKRELSENDDNVEWNVWALQQVKVLQQTMHNNRVTEEKSNKIKINIIQMTATIYWLI